MNSNKSQNRLIVEALQVGGSVSFNDAEIARPALKAIKHRVEKETGRKFKTRHVQTEYVVWRVK